MYVKRIPKIIQEKLKARERALSFSSTSTFGQEKDDGSLDIKDIGTRSVFVRMCSNKLSVPNILISGGELSNAGDLKFGVELGLQQDLNGLYNQTSDRSGKNYGGRPIPGIKNIEVGYKGSYKAIREAKVSWVVGSIADLERLTPYFLTVGKTVALDWGWVNPKASSFADMFNGETPFITFNDGKFNVNPDIFNNPFYKIQRAGGDYDALAGKISNFEMQLRQDGGFDCTTTVTAIGSFLFQKPIDKPSNQITIEDIGTDISQKKVAYDTDNIINTLINLKGILLTNVFGLKADVLNSNNKNSEDINTYLTKKQRSGINGNHIYWAKKDGFAVDNAANPQVLWMNNVRTEDSGASRGIETHIFVKWGYFEDQILNRYISVKGGKDNDIKMTMRSIDTVLDAEGLPVLVDDKIKEERSRGKEKLEEDSKKKKAAVNTFYGGQTITVESGDSLSSIASKYQIELSEILEINDIPNPNSISVGQQILLPTSAIIPPEDLPSDYFQQLERSSQSTVYNPNESSFNYTPPNTSSDEEVYSEGSNSYNVDDFYDEKTNFRGLKDLNKTGKFLKTPTLIKNKKNLLKPKDIFKFFSVELLPDKSHIPLREDEHKLLKKLSELKDSQFTKPGDVNSGRLRYMWVNIKEIQSAFGITYSKDNVGTKPDKINPPKTLENGVKNLLSQLNKNFYDFWNFEIAVDTYDPSNIKVFDKKMVDLSTDNIAYSKYKPDSHKIDTLGIYKFPSFKAGSIVKNQNLSFKIPDAMAITIMFGSNKEEKRNQSTNLHNNPEIMKLFALDKDKEGEGKVWADRYLDKIKSANVPTSEKNRFVNVGSQNTNHNSLIVENEGVTIQPQDWWDQWTGENTVDPKIGTDYDVKALRKFEVINDNVVLLRELTHNLENQNMMKDGQRTFGSAPTGNFNTTELISTYTAAQPFTTVEISTKPDDLVLYRRDGVIKSEVEKVLRNRLSGGVSVDKVDTIKVDTIIPAELSLEVDGIGGLQPGDICQTDYIQPKYNINFYKDDKQFGPFTYFQIVGINQKVDSTGWTTEVETKMRINHIPDVHDLQVGVDDEVQEEVRIDDKLPLGEYPENRILPDEEEIEDVTLDKLDFDDFTNWESPLPKVPEVHPEVEKILNTGTTNIPTKAGTFKIGSFEEFVDTENLRANTSNQILLPKLSSGLGDLVQKGSTYNNLQLKKKFELFPPVNKPYVRVPTNDEDENIDDEIAALGPIEPIPEDDYSNWKEPPQPVTAPPQEGLNLPESMPVTIIDKKAEEIKSKDVRTKKSSGAAPRIKSTYTGDYWQNDLYLYNPPHKPEWRPIFEWADGSRRHYDVLRDDDGNVIEKATSTIRAARDFDERQNYWDDNIEAPNEGGKSRLAHKGAYNPRATFKKSSTKRQSDNEFLDGEFGDYYSSLGF